MYSGFYKAEVETKTLSELRQLRRQLEATYQKHGNRATATKLAVVEELINAKEGN